MGEDGRGLRFTSEEFQTGNQGKVCFTGATGYVASARYFASMGSYANKHTHAGIIHKCDVANFPKKDKFNNRAHRNIVAFFASHLLVELPS
jgi:hypothetical protein